MSRPAGDFHRLAEKAVSACREIAAFTEVPAQTTRTFLSPPMRDCHRYLTSWMTKLGMTVRVDGAGNLRGLYAGSHSGGCTLIASHLDTVPNAGAFDGVLGVVLGVALIELFAGECLETDVEVIGFSEEEGVRFGIPFIGSRALAGTLEPAVLDATDSSGVTVRDAIQQFGLDPASLASARLHRDTRAVLEFHIEQGPVLESLDLPIAVVSGIAGQSRATATFQGQSNHAGTTPAELRRDALAAGAEWILAVERLARETPGLRATVGTIDVNPSAVNIVPGSAVLSLDARHQDDAVRHTAFRRLIKNGNEIASRRRVDFSHRTLLDQPAVPLDPKLTQLLAEAVEQSGVKPHVLSSGAGHDAMVLAPHVPTAMLFLRSPGGVSHHPDESVRVEDVARALAAGLRFLEQISACSPPA